MATKNINNENNNVVANASHDNANVINNEELEQYVAQHMDLVPRMWKNRFESWTLEEKAARIQKWEQNKKNIEYWQEKQKIENKVKALFEQRKPTTEDVLKVIDFCKSFIEASKAQEIAKIDEEIQKLTQMKSQLEKN